MKRILTIILLSCFYFLASGQNYPVDSVRITGENEHRVVYVFIGDGYQDIELADFDLDVEKVVNDFFNKTPFKEYRDFFNIYRIDVPSNESGSDHPGTATDVTEPAHEVKIVDTEFDCTFDGGGIHRLLVSRATGNAYSVLAQNTPEYDQGFILCNSPHYGGAGGNLATSSIHNAASEIVIHEIGHSFAGLWDEYWNGSGGEYPNMSRESDPNEVRWKHWLGVNGVGIYSYGNSAPQSNWYRPHQNCQMRSLNREFCPVCAEQIIKSIYALAPPLEDVVPEAGQLIMNEDELKVTATIVYPIPNTLNVSWELNGEIIQENTDTIVLSPEILGLDYNILRLLVRDDTDMIRDPNAIIEFRRNWTIVKDLDNDGFTSDVDCDDNNVAINPDSDDIPNNNIDEDCDGEDATTLVLDLSDSSISIFPNPSNGQINLKSDRQLNTFIDILSLDGKSVYSQNILLSENEVKSITLSPNLANGIYVLKIYDPHKQRFTSGLMTISK